MSSNAALSAARRRRSNPSAAVPSSTSTQSHNPPANRIIQRTGVSPAANIKQQPQFNQPPPPQMQGRMQPQLHPHPHPQSQPQQVRGAPQQQGRYQPQPSMQPPHLQAQAQPMMHPQSSSAAFPPLPPPVKTAGPLYGIPIHPLMMFKTHDNKLNEHDLSIGDCFEQLKEIDERLTVIESSSGVSGGDVESEHVSAGAGDLNDLMNDGVFINGVVDNIMNTTNFASIIENVIPLKEENALLKQQVEGLHHQVQGLNKEVEEWKERIEQLEIHMRSIPCSSSENVVPHVENVENVNSPHDEEASTCNESKDSDHSEEE